jgi:predicted glycogen debranching enzyme
MQSTANDRLELHANPSLWAEEPPDENRLLALEWLVTNGLGGYASGTVAGVCTRKYHAVLVAALPAPFGRLVMLNHLHEELWFANGTSALLTGEETPQGLSQRLCKHLKQFFLRSGLPVWHYQTEGCLLEKQIWFSYQTNTVRVAYRVLQASAPVRLNVRPAFHVRRHEEPVSSPLDTPYLLTSCGDRIEVKASSAPPLRMRMEGPGPRLILDGGHTRKIFYRLEAARGYESAGALWSPGFYDVALADGQSATLTASADEWDTITALESGDSLRAEEERRARRLALAPGLDDFGHHLTLAADQFIVAPVGRASEAARAHAVGEDARTVIAGYHWFTDWGRDTMISLEGLTLVTGRAREARQILGMFARHVRDGLIPNLFPEGEREGLYHTADATLWYFHALDRYLAWTLDRDFVTQLLPTLCDIVRHHLQGTRFGIGVDPADGLLRQGAEGYQLTWMDAKVDGWVVTPRRGKAVEINALWYNALRLLAGWLTGEEHQAFRQQVSQHAQQAQSSFNQRFWNPSRRCLYDVIDGPSGDDDSIRPNQLFALSLPHPVLDESHWEAVLQTGMETLLTPMGLRSLAPGEPNYVARYDGDLRSRDAAYHQGTVWGWLVGPLVDAWLRAKPTQRDTAKAFLEGFKAQIREDCVGTINEIFDAEAPYTARGCVAQAWSVAEVLRCWSRIIQHGPQPTPSASVTS